MTFYNLKISYRYLIKTKYMRPWSSRFLHRFCRVHADQFFYFSEKKVNKGFAHHKEFTAIWQQENSFDIHYDFATVLQTNYAEIVSSCPWTAWTAWIDCQRWKHNNNTALIQNIVSTNNDFTGSFFSQNLTKFVGQAFWWHRSAVHQPSLATKLFNSENVLGTTLEFGNTNIKFKGKITSVFEDLPQNSTLRPSAMNSENKDFSFRLPVKMENAGTVKYVCSTESGCKCTGVANKLNKIRNLDRYNIGRLDIQRLTIYIIWPAS